MLMDSKGVSGTAPGENGALFGAQEMLPKSNGEDDKFGEFVESREDLKPQIEMPAELIDNDNSVETDGEMQSSAQPTLAPQAPTQDDPGDEEKRRLEEVKATLEQINVPRDAESLPKAYEKAVNDIVSRNRKDPFKLVAEIDVARWKLMEKAFARKMGDGLNGGGA